MSAARSMVTPSRVMPLRSGERSMSGSMMRSMYNNTFETARQMKQPALQNSSLPRVARYWRRSSTAHPMLVNPQSMYTSLAISFVLSELEGVGETLNWAGRFLVNGFNDRHAAFAINFLQLGGELDQIRTGCELKATFGIRGGQSGPAKEIEAVGDGFFTALDFLKNIVHRPETLRLAAQSQKDFQLLHGMHMLSKKRLRFL